LRKYTKFLLIAILSLLGLNVDAQEIREVGFYDTPGRSIAVALLGDYAYVADYNRGLRVINISNPAGSGGG